MLKNLTIFFKKHKNLSYFLLYTLIFILCALILNSYFVAEGKSVIWVDATGNSDGLSQHYTALSYYGSYLRGIYRSLISGNFSIPLYDTAIGAGEDIITTLHYYVIGDPLTLLSFFVPRDQTESLYTFLMFLRFYLVGLAFSLFALHLKKSSRIFTLVGALSYVFCSYTMYAVVRHPYFGNPMIYFPLILLGCEYILEKKKPYLFIGMIALSGLSNFYFFYMLCFLTLIYLLVRVFDYVKKPHLIRQIWSHVWRFGIYTAVGVMLAGILLCPMLHTMISSARTSQGNIVDLFYKPSYYPSYLFAGTSSTNAGSWSMPGHTPICFLSIALLWMKPRSSRSQKIAFILCHIFFIFPIFGWFFNGMSYVTNRWCWVYPLVVGIIVATHMKYLFTLDSKKWMILTQICILYTGIGIIHKHGMDYAVGFAGVIICILVLSFIWMRFRSKKFYETLMKSAVLCLTVLGIAGMCYTRFYKANYANQFLDAEQAFVSIDNAQGRPLNYLDDTSYYRYEDNYLDHQSYQRNATLINGGHSANSYFSLISPTWSEMLQSLGHRDKLEQMKFSFDNRTMFGTLANVKYFTSPVEKREGWLPYGYPKEEIMTAWLKNYSIWSNSTSPEEKQTQCQTQYSYYQNEYALPFGYTYDSYISREEYNKLSYTQRQQALMQSAVLEQDSSLPKNNALTFTDTTVPFTVKYSDYIKVDGSTLITTKANQSITLYFNGKADQETYLNLLGVKWRAFSDKELSEQTEDWEYLSHKQQKDQEKRSRSFVQPSNATLTVSMNNTEKTAYVYSDDYIYYMGVTDYSINLGYYEQAPAKIRITFSHAGEYTLDNMLISQIDFQNYEEQTKALAKDHLENVAFSSNTVTGDITVDKTKLLCVSLPYSTGWTAYVDGKPTEIKQTDIGFMGVELTEGSHHVELKYFTPWLKLGLLLSATGVFALLLLIAVRCLIRRKRQNS